MLEWIDNNGLLAGLIMFLYSNIVSSLPSPDKVNNPWYEFLHKLLNLTAANAPKAFPQLRMLSADRKNGNKD
jgi:hypothetical protein